MQGGAGSVSARTATHASALTGASYEKPGVESPNHCGSMTCTRTVSPAPDPGGRMHVIAQWLTRFGERHENAVAMPPTSIGR